MVWRAAVKLAYDGRCFHGFQRQPDRRTVEGEVLRALGRIGAVRSANEARFKGASRTDRGVSALGNVVAFDTAFRRGELLRALNAETDDVYYYGIADVPFSFSPRRARARWYRYFLRREGLDADLVGAAAAVFRGKHDFRAFCREDGRSTVRKIDSIDVSGVGDFLIIDVRARDFLWNMVRRMVGAMTEVALGRSEIGEVAEMLERGARSFGLAPAENLVLMDVVYDFDFEHACPPTLSGRLRSRREEAFLALGFFDGLIGRCGLG